MGRGSRLRLVLRHRSRISRARPGRALRRGIDHKKLGTLLHDAKDFGLDTLDYIINSRTEYDLNFRKDYLSWHIHYHLGADEKRGLAKFSDLLQKHALGPVFPTSYV